MEKIHRDRGIVIEATADPAAKFRGEQQDLEEMVGNLVDNACKWAASQVLIEVGVVPPEQAGRRSQPADPRSTTTAAACPRRSGPRSRAAASGSTNPSRDRGWGFRSWCDLAALYGGSLCAGATRRSAACVRSWCCPAV